MSSFQASLAFVTEMDRLKAVLRRTLLHDGSRRENTAEHSWHLAVSVVAFAKEANAPFDLARAVKMAILHDIVEIDAGDTYVYDTKMATDKAEREQRAADRLFGLLEPELGRELRGLWDAFEAKACPESRFVGALDRFLPVYANVRSGGKSWREHGIKKEQVLQRNAEIGDGSRALWDYTRALVEDAARQGMFG